MTANHTTGPWTMLPEEADKDYLRIRGTRLGGRYKVANVHHIRFEGVHAVVRERDDAESMANARLIAAAPELLEAAKLVLEWYEAEDNHSGTDFYQRMQMCRDSEDAIRAAIAKATGEQT